MNSFLLKCVSMKEIAVSLFFWLLMAACRVFIDFLDKEGEWLYEYVWSFIWDILDNLILFFEAPIFGRSVGGSFPCSPPPDWIVTFLSISFAIREGSGYRIRWIKIPKGLWPPPLIFGKLCCKFFMTDMVAYMQGGMMTRQYQMHAHDFQRGANCRLEPFRKFIQFGSVTHPLDWYDY